MDIIKINGASYVQSDSAKKDLPSFLDKKIILKDEIPIYQFIDSAGLDGNAIHKVRVAREITFNFNTYLKHKPTGKILLKPDCFSELIQCLEENMLPDYRFVLDTDDKEILSRIIQQLLYLDIDIEVMLKSEEYEIRKMELFMKLSGELRLALEDAKSRIYNWNSGDAAKEYRSSILHTLSDIEDKLREIQDKDLKVAVMALRKSGKSVVVNCLLGDDYAPASIELPTFTTCIYRKKGDGRISLNYKNGSMYFDSPAGLKKYVLTEFKNILNDKIPEYVPYDMDIGYMPQINSACNYTIIDTPGPDLAGNYHKDIAYKWIGEADVALFIIDYSKHLSSSEEEFFRNIKEVFEAHQKFYSFVVVVNKLDLMYLSEEKKSSLRFIDFLRSKLKDLGYKGFIVFGVSALQYFYSLIAPQIKGCGDLKTDDGRKFRECLDLCLHNYQGKDEIAVLSFLDNQIRNLLWFHGKEHATLSDLKERSGVEQLMRYINYVAMEKAHIELFNHKMSVIDRKLEEFRTSFIGDLLSRLEQNSALLEEMIIDITRFSEEALETAKQDFSKETILKNIERDMSLARKSLYKALNMQLENVEKQMIKVLKSLSSAELMAFQKEGNPRVLADISYKIEKGVVEKLYLPVLGKHYGFLNKELAARNKKFEESKQTILEKIADLDSHLRKDYCLNCPDIVLPKMQEAFTKFEFSPVIMRLDDLFAQSLIRERLAKKKGAMGALLMLLSFGLINIKTGKFKLDDRKLKKAVFLEKKNLNSDTQKQMDEMHERLLSHINIHLDGLEQAVAETFCNFEKDCKTVFNSFINDLSILKEEINSKIAFLREADLGIEKFNILWNRIGIAE